MYVRMYVCMCECKFNANAMHCNATQRNAMQCNVVYVCLSVCMYVMYVCMYVCMQLYPVYVYMDIVLRIMDP